MPSPIRVGIIGLGRAEGEMVPGVWAARAHLPYLLASPHFTVTAVANSSVASAQASIDHHKLGPSVAAYGSPTDIASDPNVDLVLVSVRVEKHYALTKPALLAGKDIFVEWPLGATPSEAKELTALAASKGVKTSIGLQARASPLVKKLRSLIYDEKAIGEVLSTVVTATFSMMPTGLWFKGVEYYLDANSGGNPLTIFVGHFLDSFTHVLGPFQGEARENGFGAILETKFPDVKVMDTCTGQIVNEHFAKTAPDHVFLQGRVGAGTLASLSWRYIQKGEIEEEGLKWTITGTEGEIEILTGRKQWQGLKTVDVVVKIKKGDGEVEVLDLGSLDEEEGNLIGKLRNVAKNTGEAVGGFC
ncbi:hypothetical protein G7Y89_g2656 [Cudoniella acicularis]|uniref:Oxidoreductase n=1 Tax=Cudoniella acicularis TaxID=354080 RepID=A0A8H4RU31_9HELO|nr:hypothetical protein G7Y89_g2656 [Cudoniella acicularis]